MDIRTLKRWMQGLCLLIVSSAIQTSNSLPEGYDYTKYHRMEEIYKWMEDVERGNPELISSAVYGKTFEGRNITLLKIGLKQPEGKEKKVIWIDCGIHAREWIAPAFCQWFVKEIVQTYKADWKLEQMLKNLDIYVTPVLNVDGYIYSWRDNTTRLWRKSRSAPPPNSNCYGVDLNRNFKANWGMLRVSFNSCSNIYCGSAAGSEPETRAVTDFLDGMLNRTLVFLTIHSSGQLLLLPYGYPHIAAPNHDELVSVGNAAAEAIKKVHGMVYRVGTSPQLLYGNSGSSRDWARLVGINISFTFELRDTGKYGHKLPEDQIQPTCEETYAGALSMITYAHDKNFNSATLPSAGVAMTMWSAIMAVSLTTGVFV